MLADLIVAYGDIVAEWSATELDHDGPNIRLKAKVQFSDRSLLFIRQIVIGSSIFKYAYHWQDKNNELICRWDNAPHWKQLSTYPHHKHLASCDTPVEALQGGDLEAVFEEVAGKLRTGGE